MNRKISGAYIASKRLQAQRNCLTRINNILFKAAKDIVAKSVVFRIGNGPISNKKDLEAYAYERMYNASTEIKTFTEAYAETANKLLGTEGAADVLNTKFAGKDFYLRNTSHCRNFADDIVKMIVAAASLGYDSAKILSAIRTGYKTPFAASVITKAAKKNITTDIPSYGRGLYHSAYQNIARNAKVIISMAYGNAVKEYGEKNKAIGFRVKRGSTYLCYICDNEASYIHSMKDPFPPYHVSCCCFVEFIYNEKDL